MNIRKYTEDYSRDIQLVYNSEATKENYISQVKSFLNYFVILKKKLWKIGKHLIQWKIN